uniref:Uncharacterized protein n=1 Tax=Solanum tuberosum TaxID=4113 RepID=M1A2T3_SOLTU
MEVQSAQLVGIVNPIGDPPFGIFIIILVLPSASSCSVTLGDMALHRGTVRNKAADRTKKRRPEDRLNHWASRRIALVSPNVPVCQALKEKIKSAIERSSRRIVEQFRDTMPYTQSYRTSRMLKVKAKRRYK